MYCLIGPEIIIKLGFIKPLLPIVPSLLIVIYIYPFITRDPEGDGSKERLREGLRKKLLEFQVVQTLLLRSVRPLKTQGDWHGEGLRLIGRPSMYLTF